jgi:hypothetical protein
MVVKKSGGERSKLSMDQISRCENGRTSLSNVTT